MEYTVYYENPKEKRIIGKTESPDEARKIICDFLVKCNYTAPYWRTWSPEEGVWRYDVGSYTEFFEVHLS